MKKTEEEIEKFKQIIKQNNKNHLDFHFEPNPIEPLVSENQKETWINKGVTDVKYKPAKIVKRYNSTSWLEEFEKDLKDNLFK